jgi:transposase
MSEVEIRRSMRLANPIFKDRDRPLIVKIKRRKAKIRRDGRLDYTDYSELLSNLDKRSPVDERTLLTKGVAEDLKTYILRGLDEEQACNLASIGHSTYAKWLIRYPQFKEFIRRVKAQVEFETLEHIQNAAGGGVWSAAAWFLERKYPQKYGRRDVLKQQIFHVHQQFIKIVLQTINDVDPAMRTKIVNDLKAKKIDLDI